MTVRSLLGALCGLVLLFLIPTGGVVASEATEGLEGRTGAVAGFFFFLGLALGALVGTVVVLVVLERGER